MVFSFNSNIKTVGKKEINTYLLEIRNNSSAILRQEIFNFTKLIEGAQSMLNYNSSLQSDEDILNVVKGFAKDTSIVRLHIFSNTGKLYASNKNKVEQYNIEDYRDSLSLDHISVADPRYSDSLKCHVIEVAMPLYINGSKFGIIIGSYPLYQFDKLLQNDFLNGDCSIILSLSDGTILSQNLSDGEKPSQNNIFDFYRKQSKSFLSSTPEEIEYNFKTKKDGYASYKFNNVSKYISYGNVGLNDWNLIVRATEKTLLEKTANLQSTTSLLIVFITLIIIIISIIILLGNWNYQTKYSTQLKKISETDVLTQVFNRYAAKSLIIQSLNQSFKNTHHSFIMIDIDDFKQINDKFGHIGGDELLKKFAEHLKKLFTDNAIIGRMGGDEFIIYIHDYPDKIWLEDKVRSLCQSMKELSVELTNQFNAKHEMNISISVGVAVSPEDGKDFNSLYKHADIALYRSKAEGKDRFSFYDSQIISS